MGFVGPDGLYHEGDPVMADLIAERSINWKQGDHDRQRQDHKVDLLRPFNADGTPNEAFVEQYPEESQEIYKFTKSDQEIAEER